MHYNTAAEWMHWYQQNTGQQPVSQLVNTLVQRPNLVQIRKREFDEKPYSWVKLVKTNPVESAYLLGKTRDPWLLSLLAINHHDQITFTGTLPFRELNEHLEKTNPTTARSRGLNAGYFGDNCRYVHDVEDRFVPLRYLVVMVEGKAVAQEKESHEQMLRPSNICVVDFTANNPRRTSGLIRGDWEIT